MQLLQSTWFLVVLYLAVAVAILFARSAFVRIGEFFRLGSWFTDDSFRFWVAAIWPAFLVGGIAVAVVASIVLICSSLPAQAGASADDDLDDCPAREEDCADSPSDL